MNKQEMVKAVADTTGMTQVDTNKILNAIEEQVSANLKAGEKTQLTGFLTIKPTYRAARKGFDPIKKVAMDIEPTVGVSVKAGEKLRAATIELNPEDFKPAVEAPAVEAAPAAQ